MISVGDLVEYRITRASEVSASGRVRAINAKDEMASIGNYKRDFPFHCLTKTGEQGKVKVERRSFWVPDNFVEDK